MNELNMENQWICKYMNTYQQQQYSAARFHPDPAPHHNLIWNKNNFPDPLDIVEHDYKAIITIKNYLIHTLC